MSDYIATSADLTSVANAIRTKGGTSAQLAFPADFVSAVNAIPTGGGDTKEVARKILNTSITEYVDDSLTEIRAYAFYNCSNLETFICHNIQDASFQNSFNAASKLKAVAFPKDMWGGYKFNGNPYLEAIDISTLSRGSIATNYFSGCSKLNKVIIRTATVAALDNLNAFNNTPFASGKAGGTLYVPQSLVSSYQTASNWSTIFGYGSGAQNSIKSIESTHTDQDAFIDLTLYYADGIALTA